MSYIELTSPMVLSTDPVLAVHAVTKQYIENKKLNLDSSAFTHGTLTAAAIPSTTGDLVLTTGSNVAELSDTGVAAGSYAKVTINDTGRIVSSGYLTTNDFPSVTWSKIAFGKPTTASGYGISNLICLAGCTVSGSLISTATASNPLHAVTKGYIDNVATSSVVGTIAVGDIIRKPVGVTPSGFLRCNGGLVSTTVYSGLFGVLGYGVYFTATLDYTSYTAIGCGQPWRKQYDINTTQSGDITGWTRATDLPATIMGTQVVVTKSRVYILGGQITGSASSAVYTAVVNADGTLGTWGVSVSLPSVITYSQVVVTKNRVYLLGGQVNGSNSAVVYTTTINSDGTLGTWATGTSLPVTMYQSQSIVTKNRVYMIGGSVGGLISAKVYAAPINSDGTLGVWTAGTAIPGPLSYYQPIVTKNRVYLLGGYAGTSYVSTVYTAPINADGTLGSWVAGTSMPAKVYGSVAVTTKGKVYLLGGYINGGHSGVVHSAFINTDGTLGSWSTGTSLPVTLAYSQVIVTKNYMYTLGGFVNSTQSARVYVAAVTGGLNDYSYLYDGSVNKFDGSDLTGTLLIGTQNGGGGGGTSFSLPDFTTAESGGINYYIKY